MTWVVLAARLGWLVLAVVASVKCVVRPDLHSDFPIYWDTGRDWWFHGHVPITSPFYVQFINHQMAPFLAELLGPFCVWPLKLGGVLWVLTGTAGLYAAMTVGLRRLAPGLTPSQRTAVLLLAPWCGLHSLYNGQLNVPIAACLLGGTAAAASRRWLLAGLLLAVAVHTKTYPVALAMVLAALSPRRLLPAFAAAWLALAALPFLTHPADLVVGRYRDWLLFLVSGENFIYHLEYGFDLQDVRLLLSRWVSPVPARAFVPVQVVTGGIVLACTLIRRRSADDHDALGYGYGLTSMWLVLFGPCTQAATYLLAGPAVALLLVDAARRGVGRVTWAVLGTAALFAGPLQTTMLGHVVWHWTQDGRFGALGLAVLFGYQASRCCARSPVAALIPPAPYLPLSRAA